MSRERDLGSWHDVSGPADGAAGLRPSPSAVAGQSRSSSQSRLARANDKLHHAIEQLGPYPSLAVLAIPVCLVEPLKLVAVAVAGKGHWITGTAMMIGAYAVSLFVVERLFLIVKPKLLKLRWFARIWFRFVILRHRVTAPFRRLVAK